MKWPRPPFENGKRPSRIAARNLDGHLVAAYVDRLSIASLHNDGGPGAFAETGILSVPR